MSEISPDPVVKTEEKDENLDRKTIFVRAVPLKATSEELSEYFSQFVPVKHAVIVNDSDQNSRGFGFVSFTMEEDALTALVEAKKHKFQNKFLRVDIAKRRERKSRDDREEKPEKVEKVQAEPVEKRKARLIVRNLPWSCKSPDTLKKLFNKFGAVHDAYIPTKKGGLMRGFAFVTMKKTAAAERAVKESVGLKIDGREVAVDLAVEKSKWETLQEDEQEEATPKLKSTARERTEVKTEEDADDVEVKEEEDDEVEESDNEDAEEFGKLNEINSDDEVEDEEEDEEEKPKQNRQDAFSVFVRNIPYDADRESLTEHFSQFGPIKYALPVIDKVTGLARGSAFVSFNTEEGYNECLDNAPSVSTTSMLISDDVEPAYVFQGRILSIVSTVDRSSASKLEQRNLEKRKEAFGKEAGEKDKRNLFLLNEGRVTENSKLAQFMLKADMEVREKSYKLRVQQLNKNPTLHLSLTRLAVRNLPRAMTAKSLKALGRKAVVQFATEVKDEKRHPLSKEEVSRSADFKKDNAPERDEDAKKKTKNTGVVKQSKIIMEVKGSGETGRSRGYGFIEFRDHKAALMGLRWLNNHEVTIPEILEGLNEEEKKLAQLDGLNKRRLIVEFAVENAQVVKRRRDRVMVSRHNKRPREDGEEGEEQSEEGPRKFRKKGPSRKGNMNKGPRDTTEAKPEKEKSGMSDDLKRIIGRKRKSRKGK